MCDSSAPKCPASSRHHEFKLIQLYTEAFVLARHQIVANHPFLCPRTFFSAKSRFWIVVLGNLQATTVGLCWPVRRQRDDCFYCSVSWLREGGCQIQAMLFEWGLRFGWGKRAHRACGRGICYVVVGNRHVVVGGCVLT